MTPKGSTSAAETRDAVSPGVPTPSSPTSITSGTGSTVGRRTSPTSSNSATSTTGRPRDGLEGVRGRQRRADLPSPTGRVSSTPSPACTSARTDRLVDLFVQGDVFRSPGTRTCITAARTQSRWAQGRCESATRSPRARGYRTHARPAMSCSEASRREARTSPARTSPPAGETRRFLPRRCRRRRRCTGHGHVDEAGDIVQEGQVAQQRDVARQNRLPRRHTQCRRDHAVDPVGASVGQDPGGVGWAAPYHSRSRIGMDAETTSVASVSAAGRRRPSRPAAD